jgi:hypothetical protein
MAEFKGFHPGKAEGFPADTPAPAITITSPRPAKLSMLPFMLPPLARQKFANVQLRPNTLKRPFIQTTIIRLTKAGFVVKINFSAGIAISDRFESNSGGFARG